MIKTKLEILFKNDVLDKTAYDSLLLILDDLIKKNIIQDTQQADFFLTHLAMACARHKNKENINQLDEVLKKEIYESKHYNESSLLWEQLQKRLPLTLHKSEIDYIYLHLINFLNTR